MSAERIFLLVVLLTVFFVYWELKYWFIETLKEREPKNRGTFQWRYFRYIGFSLAFIGLFYLMQFYGPSVPNLLDFIFFFDF